jgi:membrane dipeptidase
MNLPIIDTHCDILSYLAKIPNASPDKSSDIACALPLLKKGNVKMQVCAIYTDVAEGSMESASRQAEKYKGMLHDCAKDVCQADKDFLKGIDLESKIGLIAAVENAAGLADEKAPISEAFEQLENLIKLTSKIGYISLTHHTENRFGGGNYTEGIGLKDDGKKILDYTSGRKIAIDLSHTSDLLAEGILNHIDTNKLQIPVIASHSNMRSIWDHKRNLTDEFAQEVIRRKGIIGINFLRAFLDDKNPETIIDHILHAIQIGGENSLCFGADFFYTKDFPDKKRHPFYFPLVEDASRYPSFLDELSDLLPQSQLEKLAYKNCQRFFKTIL